MEGRWTLKPNSHPFVSATLEGPRVVAITPVVPCDDAAVERAALAIGQLIKDTNGDATVIELGQVALRAAGETP